MMAKMFYTLEETKAALGRGEEEIKQLAREGRLREFRDGPRLMFKADQVEQLKGELGSGDAVDIGVSDSGGLIGLVDTTGASGTSITLSEADTGAHGSVAGSSGTGMKLKDDTSLSVDLGLSGSLGGVPSPGRPAGTPGTGLSGTAGGTRGGINVMGAEDSGIVDSAAQTVISGGYRSQMPLEGVGSGSGLLDLTRESDDTSLGAVLDEITPGAGRRGGTATGGEGIVDIDDQVVTPRTMVAPTVVEAHDPMAQAFGWMSLAGFLMMLLAVYVLVGGLVGVRSAVTDWFRQNTEYQLFYAVGIGLLLTIVLFVIGLIAGKAGGARR